MTDREKKIDIFSKIEIYKAEKISNITHRKIIFLIYLSRQLFND
jgi:hypothetical protein